MIVTMPTVLAAVTTAIVASPMTWEQATLIICPIILAMSVDYLRWMRRTYEDDFIVRLLVAAQQRRWKA